MVKGRKGYREFHYDESGKEVPGPDANGRFQYAYEFKPNEGGKLTREAHEALEWMKPATDEGLRRSMSQQTARDRVRLRDTDGRSRIIDAALAEQTARRNGWSHVWRAGGLTVESGVEGDMLWRQVADGWEPTGRKTVGVLGEPADVTVVQFDPDGEPWTWNGSEWVRECNAS